MLEELIEVGIVSVDGNINRNNAKMLNGRPNLLEKVIIATNFLPIDTSLVERLYCIIHHITSPILCGMCDNRTTYLSNKKFYQEFCSRKCAAASPEKKQSRLNTVQRIYGGNAPMSNTSVKDKARGTNLSKYGAQYHQQTSIGKSVRESTCLERYGNTNVISTLGRAAFIKKYGVVSPMLVPEFKSKIAKTIKHQYNRAHPNQQHLTLQALDKLNNKEWLHEQHIINKLTLTEISSQLCCDVTTVMNYFHKHGIQNIRFAQSSYERRIVEALQVAGISEIVTNTKHIISPLELDIFLPTHKVAIEVCGLYWHADIHPRITTNYHQNKYIQCRDKGIKLLTIFEDELIHQFPLVMDKILYILGKSIATSTYARKCVTFIPTIEQKRIFMNATHIQGVDRSTKTLGLKLGDTIVAMMSLKHKLDDIWEITRYCTIGKVVGGFSKLLNLAKNSLHVKKFETFADLRWGNGELYKTLGFQVEYTIPPTFYHIDGTRRRHRSTYMKHKLSKLLPNFDSTLTELENCDNAGILRIWDCGKIKYTLSD